MNDPVALTKVFADTEGVFILLPPVFDPMPNRRRGAVLAYWSSKGLTELHLTRSAQPGLGCSIVPSQLRQYPGTHGKAFSSRKG